MRMIASHWQDAPRLLGSRWVEGVALLFVRVALAGVFWRSGRSKVVEGTWLQVSDATRYLFEYEYSAVPLPPAFAAQMATLAEFVLPILIALGLATRLSALALLGMTLVIEVFVYPDAYPTHGTWAAVLLYLMATGPGKLSIDHLIARYYKR